MPDPIITPLVNVTARALESFNPMGGTIVDQPLSAQRLKLAPKVETPEIVEEEVKIEVEEDDFEFDQIEPIVEKAPEPEVVVVEKKKSTKKAKNPIIETRSQEGLPSYRCEFEGRDIFVGFPCYKTTNPVTCFSLIAMALDFGRDKIRFDMAIGDSKIEHARNRLAHKFLETDAKWMLMVDDDIIPCIGRPEWSKYWVQNLRNIPDPPLKRHVLHRLMGAGKTLVGAPYFGRQEGGALMASDQSLAPRVRAYEDSVVEVDWVATGCMLVHRKVFEDIRAKFGDELKIKVPDYDYDYFRPFDSAHGEDVSFCKRAKQAGHQPHLDLGLPVSHLGYKTY
jgi:hypothetical protein